MRITIAKGANKLKKIKPIIIGLMSAPNSRPSRIQSLLKGSNKSALVTVTISISAPIALVMYDSSTLAVQCKKALELKRTKLKKKPNFRFDGRFKLSELILHGPFF